MKRNWVVASCALVLVLSATAERGMAAVPVVNSLSPSSKEAGLGTFTMTVTGSAFTTGSVVRWNGTNVSTGFVSSTQLVGTISSALIAKIGTATVTVYTSGRKGGTSNSKTFTIVTPTTTAPPPPPPPPAPTPLSITTTSLPSSTAGTSFTASVGASGGTPSYGWSLVNGGGSLPPGLTFQANGTISGTPSSSGTFAFTTQASDSASQIAQKVLSITVAADPNATPPPTTTRGSIIFQEDFESGAFTKWAKTNLWSSINPALTSSVKRNGTYSYEQRYTICGDSTNTTCGGISQDVNRFIYKVFDSTNGYPTGLDHIFIRGYVYHKTPEPGGTLDKVQRKLIYFFDGSSVYDWWGFLATDSSNGVLPLRLSTNSKSATVGVPAVTYWSLANLSYDRWHCLEVEVKANTPGASDGRLTVWVDGVQVFHKSDVNLRGSYSTGIKVVRFGEQTNRYNYNSIEEYRYWDDIAISTGYIGP